MRRFQGYWTTEQPMTPKAFCARMGETTCRRVDLAPDAIYEVRCMSAGHLYVAMAATATQAYRRVAEHINQEDHT